MTNSKFKSMTSYALYFSFLYIFFVITVIKGFLEAKDISFPLNNDLLALTQIILLFGSIYFMFEHQYEIWRFIIDYSKRHKSTTSIRTPGQAIGFQFIPFFNLYWHFKSWGNIPKHLNQIADCEKIEKPGSGSLGIIIAILMILSFITFQGGIIFFIINFYIFIPMLLSSSITFCSKVITIQNNSK